MTRFLIDTVAHFNGKEIKGKKHATKENLREVEKKLSVRIRKVKNELFYYLTGEVSVLSPDTENVVHFLISFRKMVLSGEAKYTTASKKMVYEMLRLSPTEPLVPAVDAFITGKNYFAGKSIRRFAVKDLPDGEDISYAYVFNVPFDVVGKVKKAMEVVKNGKV